MSKEEEQGVQRVGGGTSSSDNNVTCSPNDLVFRNGFPALYHPGDDDDNLRGGQRQPLITGDEPLPKHMFASHAGALVISNDDLRNTMLRDCERVFTARVRQDDAAYSAGCTYFCPCQLRPRCALEGLALQIFQAHVEGLDGMYNPEQSGAEWWTLMLDSISKETETKNAANDGNDEGSNDDNDDDENEDDEVGMHFDADYGLEAQMRNVLLHPRVATVTYLSNEGAPTLVLDKQSPPPSDPERTSLNGPLRRAWLSGPQFGKHIAFDGRLLHGAPALFFPAAGSDSNTDEIVAATNTKTNGKEGDERERKRQKMEETTTANAKRVTFLVNVWLNHCPLDAELLDEDLCQQMETPWQVPGASEKTGESYIPPFQWTDPDLSKSDGMEKLCLKASKDDPAGTDEVVVCERIVTFSYNPTMAELHAASKKAAAGASVELDLDEGAISLSVGDRVEDEESEEDEEEIELGSQDTDEDDEDE